MEIDRNHLPGAPAVLPKMVVGLLEELDTQGQRLRQVQHLLEQLLRARYRPKRERVSENQLFLFAVAMLSAGPPRPPDHCLHFPHAPTYPTRVFHRRLKPLSPVGGQVRPRWGLLFPRAPSPFSPVRDLCPCQLMASPPRRGDSRKDPASATLGPDGGSSFVSFPTRSIMGIHLGTMLRKSAGSGGRFLPRRPRHRGSSTGASMQE